MSTTKFALGLLISLILLTTLAGCRGAFLGAATPELAVRQVLEQPAGPAAAGTLQVLGMRPLGKSMLVLYSYISPATNARPALPMFGYHQVVSDTGLGGWRPAGGGAGSVNNNLAEGELIDFGAGTTGGSDGWLSVVYGQTTSPKVAAVEATFDNGQVVRDAVTGGVFAAVLQEQADWCELRVLGQDGQVLQTKSPGPVPALKAAAGEAPGKCPQ